jgi:O-antigen/teichoic acid export membrane protein
LIVRAARAVRWSTSAMIVVTVVQFAQVAVLARLLPTADFGLMAMISVLLAFGIAYADMGLSNAVIYR